MAAQSFLAKLGLRTATLGTAASLAIAAPLSEGSLIPAAHTDATRIGMYWDRTASFEKASYVVLGVEQFSITTFGAYISGNALALASMPANIAGTALWISGPDGATNDVRVMIDSYGASTSPNITGRSAGGTASAPTASALNAIILNIGARGYGATGYGAGNRSIIRTRATESWTDTAQGTKWEFLTTQTGTTTATTSLTIKDDGGLTIAGRTITTVSPLLDMTRTWNEGATVFTGLKLNITDTASAAASLFVDFQVAASSKYSVDKTGNITANGTTQQIGKGAVTTSIGDGTVNPICQINGAAGNDRTLRFSTAGSRRWQVTCGQIAESGANAGSQFTIIAYDDSGTLIDSPITITRVAGGTISIGRSITMASATNIVLNTGTGTTIGTGATQKLGFYGVTAIAQRAGAAQAAVVTTGSTNVTPFGYATAAQADAIVTLVNELRAWAVVQGFIKGSA